ncbi:MAG: ABC transporter permease [Candidatus Puniceispirillaceae bacterium]
MQQEKHITASVPAPDSWALAWRLARREMRGSLTKFRIFLSALMLGVAAIGAVGSVAESMRSGIAGNARLLLGGDIELSSLHLPAEAAIMDKLERYGEKSDVVQMRAMLTADTSDAASNRRLVELKAVDQNWPLIGEAEVRTAEDSDIAMPLDAALSDNGAVVEAALLRALDLKVGDTARLGEMDVRISGVLTYEPDRSVSFISFGPRLLISQDTLAASGLQQPGSFITYRTRLLLTDPSQSGQLTAELQAELEDSYVRVRELNRAAPGFTTFIDRAEVFLVLVGLTALLIGGLGVGGAVRAWLASRMPVIATLKCVGASAQMIFRVYLLQVMSIAFIGVMAGLILAAFAPIIAANILSSYVTVPLVVQIFPVPLFIAGSFGLLTAFIFALVPLARAQQIRAAHLFRSLAAMPDGKLPILTWVGLVTAGLGLALLAWLATGNWLLTLGFIGGALVSLFILSGLGEMLLRFLRRLPAPSWVPGRIALSAITRPGSPLRAVVIAFGLGLSVLVAITLTRANLDRQIDSRVAEQAPDWFFLDIQPQQVAPFESLLSEIDGFDRLQKTPMLRGRVVAINNVPSNEIEAPENSEWILRGDRAITWSDTIPYGTELELGEWWDEDYDGPPLISISHEAFTDFGLALGDTITMNVLGREITGQIANTRNVQWESFSINFVFVASTNALRGAPHSWIAAAYTQDEAAASEVEKAVTRNFANISAISVKNAVATATKVIDLLGGAIGLTALVTMVSGIAVLAGTVASTEAQRLADSIILKVLGATRRDILLAWMLEYALLGLLTALAASLIGTLASWAVITQLLDADFVLDITLVLQTAILGAAATSLLGLLGAMRSLGHKPGPHLREVV